MSSTKKRSLIKTVTWRVIATTDTFILTLLSATWFSEDLALTHQRHLHWREPLLDWKLLLR